MISPLIVSLIVTGAVLCYASILDLHHRRVPFRTWYPVIGVGIPVALAFYIGLFLGGQIIPLLILLTLTGIFCATFYLFAYFGLFGGADAWALIFISLFVPSFPSDPVFGYPPIPFFPFAVLINAVILNLAVPAGIFLWNLSKGNRAPMIYMFFGFPVDGDKLHESFGFLMEEISEENDSIRRRFVPVRELFSRTLGGNRTLYTRELADNPGKYRDELAMFKKAGRVWILFGIPFLIPITAGFFIAAAGGDILFTLMRAIAGA